MRSALGRVAGLLLGVLLAASTHAQIPPRPLDLFDLGAPVFTTFSVRDGLPASVMAGIRVDRQGFVWASSAEEVARYDGRQWQTEGAFAARGVLGALSVSHDGRLWMATRDRGILHFDGTRWQPAAGVPARVVRRVSETVDAQGHHDLWALSFDAGLLHLDGDRWARAAGADELPLALSSLVRTSTLGGGERWWAGSKSHGLWYREKDGHWQPFRDPRLESVQIEDLMVTRRGGHEQLWISVFDRGLWRLDEHGLRVWSKATGELPSDDLYSLAHSVLPDGDVVVWAASRGGLV